MSATAITGKPSASCPPRSWPSLINARWPIEPLERNYRGEVARRYGFTDGAGEVGFISSVTQAFCGDCSRARLSSDGALYTCLFAAHGTSLRDPLRAGATDDELGGTHPPGLVAAARTATASCAPTCARAAAITPRSRCTTSAVEHGIRTHPSHGPQSTDDGGCRRQGGHPPRRQAPRRASGCRVPCCWRCADPATAPRRGRSSTPRSSPACMAAKRTSELIPFCHPLLAGQLQAGGGRGPRAASGSCARYRSRAAPGSRWRP